MITLNIKWYWFDTDSYGGKTLVGEVVLSGSAYLDPDVLALAEKNYAWIEAAKLRIESEIDNMLYAGVRKAAEECGDMMQMAPVQNQMQIRFLEHEDVVPGKTPGYFSRQKWEAEGNRR